MTYEHCFTKQAAQYARYRPKYPKELFDYLLSIVPENKCAWDCGTGNGQVALSLADHFASVIATDVSPNQIKHAFLHPKISYKIAKAESSSIPSHSVDLVTVGNALHWFEVEKFYQEVKRVLKPDSVVAVFQTGFQKIDSSIDKILLPFETEFLKDYWTDRNRLAMGGYQNLPFPFERLTAPSLQFSLDWNFADLKGFVSSWSAVQKYKDQNGSDPFESIEETLLHSWGGSSHIRRKISWDLELQVGRS